MRYLNLSVQESTDGQAWQTVPYIVSDPVHYPDYWLGFTVTATFAPGTTDIRISWSDLAVPLYNDPWASQWLGLKVGRS
ncbi:MAG: hypothetical protein H0X24_25610 [Ktedonobacterales bacterium]|nr:hypothetical protein [Ktedonobacterales bacterium]